MDISKLWTLNWFDVGKGLLIAVLSALLDALYQLVQIWQSTGNITFKWEELALVVLTAALAYLMKQFGTGADGKFLCK